MFAAGGEDQISWGCHVGGIVAGAVLVLRAAGARGQPVLDSEIMTPRAVRIEQPSAGAADRRPQPAPRWGRQ